jgi:hypothetical protein
VISVSSRHGFPNQRFLTRPWFCQKLCHWGIRTPMFVRYRCSVSTGSTLDTKVVLKQAMWNEAGVWYICACAPFWMFCPLLLLSKDVPYNRGLKTTRIVHQETGNICPFLFLQNLFGELIFYFWSRVLETLTRVAIYYATFYRGFCPLKHSGNYVEAYYLLQHSKLCIFSHIKCT